MSTGALVAVGTLLLAVAAGLLLRARTGTIKGSRVDALPRAVLDVLDPAADVTLVQLSTTFCAPCRHARARLTAIAEQTGGLAHAEIDLTDRPDVAEALAVLRTPTTLAVSRQGAELLRVGGVPERDSLLAALAPHLSPARPA